MAFRSPTEAWATWLNRPQDLDIIATNSKDVRAALDAVAKGDLQSARLKWEGVPGDLLLKIWDEQVIAMRDKSLWPASLHSIEKTRPGAKTKLYRRLSERIFDRDGYKCGYCGIDVVTQWKNGDIPRLVTAFPDVTDWLVVKDGELRLHGHEEGLTNRDVAKWLWITAVADHIHPASDGGPTEPHNLITSCAGCNYSKMDWTLTQLDVLHPVIPG